MWHTWGQSHGIAGFIGAHCENAGVFCSAFGRQRGVEGGVISSQTSHHTLRPGPNRWSMGIPGPLQGRRGQNRTQQLHAGIQDQGASCALPVLPLATWLEGHGPFWKWTISSSRLAWGKVNIPKLGPHPSALRETLRFYQKGFCSHPHIAPTESSGLSTVPHCFHAEAHLQE